MIEAWIVLPAFGLAYLVAAPGPLAAAARPACWSPWAVAGAGVAGLDDRGHAGAGRAPAVRRRQPQRLRLPAGVRLQRVRPVRRPDPAAAAGRAVRSAWARCRPAGGPPARLLHGDLGRDTGWLLPAAFVIAAVGHRDRGRRPRGDPLRACFILWGGWLLTLAVAFSLTTTINPYYTAALTPAVAALLGAGAAACGRGGHGAAAVAAGGAGPGGRAGRDRRLRRVAVHGPARAPGWLVPAVIAVGIAAVVVVLGSLAIRG